MDLNPMKMFRVIIFALIDSVIIFFFPFLCVVGTGSSMATLPVFGMSAFTYLILVAQIKVLFLTNSWNVVSLVNWVLMIVGYLLFLVLLSNWLFLSTVSHKAFLSMVTDRCVSEDMCKEER